MKRSLILDTTVRLVFDSVMVLSVYMLFAGHNRPGGGFIGGLVAGGGLALRYLAEGMSSVRSFLPFSPWTVLSAGLFISVTDTIVPVVLGDSPLESVKWTAELPVLGHVGLTSATIFDTGVYLIVIGLMLMILEALGDDEPIDLGLDLDLDLDLEDDEEDVW